MRLAIALMGLLAILATTPSSPAIGAAIAASSTHIALDQPSDQPSGQAQIDINIHHGGRAWWASPVWIAIGAIALVLLIVIIALAVRGGGGGTTIIKE